MATTPIDVGYARHWTATMSNPAVTTATAVGAGARLSASVVTAPFTGGLVQGSDFVASYEGELFFQQSTSNSNFHFTLSTLHTLVGGAVFTSETHLTIRCNRNVEYSFPMSHFDARVRVAPGTFTDASGKEVTLTAADLARTVVIGQDIIVERLGGGAWSADRLEIVGGKGVWWQLLQTTTLIDGNIPSSIARDSDIPTELPPTDGSVTAAKLDSSLVLPDSAIPADIARDSEIPTELPPTDGSVGDAALAAEVSARVAPTPTPATRGQYLRQSPAGETLEFTGPPTVPEAPVLTAYADVGDFDARSGGQRGAAADGDLVVELLAAAAQYIDRRLGWAPGMLAPGPHRTVRFWPQRAGSSQLFLRRAEGAFWLEAGVAATAYLDMSGSGDADYTWPLPSAFVEQTERSLSILGSHRDAPIGVWPSPPDGWVDIAAPFGRAAAPRPVVELNVRIARLMFDSGRGGAAAVLDVLETGMPASSEIGRLWRLVEMQYSAGRPERLGVPMGGRQAVR